MHALLLHNPAAGPDEHSAEDLLASLQAAGYETSYHNTRDGGLTKVLEKAKALRKAGGLIVVAGGDGTVAKVLKRLPYRDLPVAILPLGTANNIARSLGVIGTAEALIAGWAEASRRKVRIGRVNGPWGSHSFIEAVGLGSFAQSIADADGVEIAKRDRLTKGRKVFRKALAKAEVEELDITVDGEPLPRDLLFVEVMNIGYAGPRLRLAPSAGAGDGLLDVVTVQDAQRKDFLAWLDDAETTAPAPVGLRKGRVIGFQWSGSPLRIDDQSLPAPEQRTPIAIELEEEPLEVLVPAPKEADEDPPRDAGQKNGKNGKKGKKA